MKSYQFECKNLSVGYENNIVIKNLNFKVNKGEYICILGENGSGKTTLMKTILGLIKPISGIVIYNFNKKNIGYLTQQTDIQRNFPATVFEVVSQGLQNKVTFRPFYLKKEKEKIYEAMKKLSVLKLKDKCFGELSGGQQQRVLLARALLTSKEIIFLDEPSSGLDTKLITDFYTVINELNKNLGITVVMISHDVDNAIKYATHILHTGKKCFYGTKSEYLKSEISCVLCEHLKEDYK